MPAGLENLTLEEYMKMVTSRERRSMKRSSLIYKKLIEKVDRFKKTKPGKSVRTQVREAVILPSWIGVPFEIYNGKEYQKIMIAPNMLGHRLGEFVYSTKRVQHSAPGIRATRGSKFLAVK
jgi:small subunit ribosomal protein S19